MPVYDEIRTERLAEWDAAKCGSELDSLGLFSQHRADAFEQRLDDADWQEQVEAWKAAALRLYLAILDTKVGFARLQTAITGAILNLDSPEGDQALLERFDAEQARSQSKKKVASKPKAQPSKKKTPRVTAPVVHGLDAFLASVRRHGVTRRLEPLLDAAMATERRTSTYGEIRFADFDAPLARITNDIPSRFLTWMIREEWLGEVPTFAKALTERLLAPTASRCLADYLEILDDDTMRKKLPSIPAQLLAFARERESADAFTALFERARYVSRQVVVDAINALSSPREVFDLVSPFVPESSDVRNALKAANRSQGVLHDPRWISLAQTRFVGALVVEIASDPDNPIRSDALAILIKQEEQRRADTIDRRAAIEDLGNTGHADALPTLLYAMNDRSIGSAMALTLGAIGKCGTLDTIPELEKWLDSTWSSYVSAAITHIQTRAKRLTREKILAACEHQDATIANLARQARDGDDAAIHVLEDALRERGELLS